VDCLDLALGLLRGARSTVCDHLMNCARLVPVSRVLFLRGFRIAPDYSRTSTITFRMSSLLDVGNIRRLLWPASRRRDILGPCRFCRKTHIVPLTTTNSPFASSPDGNTGTIVSPRLGLGSRSLRDAAGFPSLSGIPRARCLEGFYSLRLHSAPEDDIATL
jgi:hypothetical protein